MTVEMTVKGNVGNDPQIVYGADGTPRLRLSIAATPRRLDKQTNQWGDDGAPVWISATLWRKDAEMAVENIHKGDQVAVSGILKVGSYQSDGVEKNPLETVGARLLGWIPKQARQPQNASQASQVARTAPQTQNVGAYSSGGNMAPQNGAQDPAGNLGNVEQQFNAQTLPPF